MMLASKYAIPAMVDSGDGGAIVNVSSIGAQASRVDGLQHLQGCGHGLDTRDGRRPRFTGHSCQLCSSRTGLHAHGSAHGMAPDLRDKRRAASVLGIRARAGHRQRVAASVHRWRVT